MQNRTAPSPWQNRAELLQSILGALIGRLRGSNRASRLVWNKPRFGNRDGVGTHGSHDGCPTILAALIFLIINGAGLAIGSTNDSVAQASWRLPRTNLLVYHGRDGEILPVKSPANWQMRRAEILQGFQQIAGTLPGREKRCALDARIEHQKDCGGFEQRCITYASEPGSRVPAYLLIPKSALESGTRCPAVLCLHPTDSEFGNRVVVETLRDNYPAYARELTERGLVTLSPAYPLLANYQPKLKALGWQSGTLKAVWDNIRGLDLLETLSFVKHGSYGAIGHSLGGHNAIFTAVFDSRIKVVVSSCGFDSFLDYYGGDPSNWQPGRGWCQTRYMPRLADYCGRLAEIPFDFHELVGALAPRPIFVNAPLGDDNFKWRSVDAVVKSASTVYQLYGVPGNLTVAHPDCAHAFPRDEREQAYHLLLEALR